MASVYMNSMLCNCDIVFDVLFCLYLADKKSIERVAMSEKTVLITGCSEGGLGEALGKAFRAQGFRVLATVRNMSKSGFLTEIPGIEILELDVTSEDSVRQCAKAVEKITGGSLDVLVNNAGAGLVLPLLDTPIDAAKKIYDVNVWGMLSMTQAMAPMLVKAKGAVCNISSVMANMTSAWAGT